MSEQKQRSFSKKMSHYLLWWRRSLDLRGVQYFFHLMGWAYTTTDCVSMQFTHYHEYLKYFGDTTIASQEAHGQLCMDVSLNSWVKPTQLGVIGELYETIIVREEKRKKVAIKQRNDAGKWTATVVIAERA